jgi:hypothetical protein
MRTNTTISICRETELENGTVVGEEYIEIEASYYAGRNATYWEPEEHPEVEILSASINGEEVELSREEEERVIEKIMKNPPERPFQED